MGTNYRQGEICPTLCLLKSFKFTNKPLSHLSFLSFLSYRSYRSYARTSFQYSAAASPSTSASRASYHVPKHPVRAEYPGDGEEKKKCGMHPGFHSHRIRSGCEHVWIFA